MDYYKIPVSFCTFWKLSCKTSSSVPHTNTIQNEPRTKGATKGLVLTRDAQSTVSNVVSARGGGELPNEPLAEFTSRFVLEGPAWRASCPPSRALSVTLAPPRRLSPTIKLSLRPSLPLSLPLVSSSYVCLHVCFFSFICLRVHSVLVDLASACQFFKFFCSVKSYPEYLPFDMSFIHISDFFVSL